MVMANMQKNVSRGRGLKVDTMRAVDYWAGMPLCALSSLLLRLIRPANQPKSRPQNVLLIELSEMGSAILVDPAMEDLKARGANLHFLIFKHNKASLDLLGTVPSDNIFCMRADGLVPLLTDTVRFLLWARQKKIDTVIDLELFSRFTALLAGWCGAARVIGFYRFHNEGLYRGEMLTERVMYNPHVHITRNFFSLVHAAFSDQPEWPLAKIRTPDSALTLKRASIADHDVERVRRQVMDKTGWDGARPLVLLNANASEFLPQRRWAQDRFAALARRVLDSRGDALVLLTGSPAEREGLDEIIRSVGDARCVNFAGDVAFSDLLALYRLSLVMVTNDSGPAHFASVTRMPTIVLFGPETPDLYRSLGRSEAVYAGLHCSPCVSAWNHRKTPCSAPKCLDAIGVDEVFERVRRHLDTVPVGQSLPAGE
jgi:ADP-heptose:LPS heptosyltransferase